MFDSSALLAIAFEEEGAEAAAAWLDGALMSAVNASEVVAKFVDAGASSADARSSLLVFGLTIRPFDETLAVAAGLMRSGTRGRGLSLGDRASRSLRRRNGADSWSGQVGHQAEPQGDAWWALALARRERARVVTADRAWAGLDVGVDLELIR